MKRLFILFLCLVLVLLASCNQTGGNSDDVSKEVSSKLPTLSEYLSDFDTSAFSNAYSLTQAQNAVQKYRDLRASYVGGPVEFLVALGYDREQIETTQTVTALDGNIFYKTSIDYNNLLISVNQYMTQQWFEKEQVWLGSFTLKDGDGCFRRDNDNTVLVLRAYSKDRHVYKVNTIRKGTNNTYITSETITYPDGTTKDITAKVGLTNQNGNIVVAYWEETSQSNVNEILPAPLS